METPTTLLHGVVHLPDAGTDAAPYRAWLAEHGVIAAVGTGPDGAVHLNLATRDGRPLVLVDGTVQTPWTVVDLLNRLTSEVGGAIEVADYQSVVGDPSVPVTPAPAATPAHTVLLSHRTAAGQPGFTIGSTVGYLAGAVEDWSVVRFNHDVPEVGLDWASDELPAVWLRSDRSIAVQTAPGPRPQVVLRHFPAPPPVELLTEEGPGEYSAAMVALHDPQLSSNSEMRLLAEEGWGSGDLDLLAVSEALQSPHDDAWSTRVLESLGLPTVAADVAEGRCEVPGDGTALDTWHSVRALEQAADHHPRSASLASRLYGTSTRHPLMALSTIVPEILVGVALIITVLTADTHPWWHWLVVLFALGCLVDAVVDSSMMIARLRRRSR